MEFPRVRFVPADEAFRGAKRSTRFLVGMVWIAASGSQRAGLFVFLLGRSVACRLTSPCVLFPNTLLEDHESSCLSTKKVSPGRWEQFSEKASSAYITAVFRGRLVFCCNCVCFHCCRKIIIIMILVLRVVLDGSYSTFFSFLRRGALCQPHVTVCDCIPSPLSCLRAVGGVSGGRRN